MKATALVGLFCIICIYGCASASGGLEDRVILLEQQNAVLEQKLLQSEKELKAQIDTNDKLRTSSAETNATLDELRAGIQALTGRVDELDFSVQKRAGSAGGDGTDSSRLSQVEELARTNQERIIVVEKYLDINSTVATPTKTETGGAKPVITRQEPTAQPAATPRIGSVSDAELYASGKTAYDKGQYEDARGRFQELVASYPKSENADNAQFWIGESYYHQEWYEKAIMEYQKVIENYPDGNKVPAALLKQGLAFYNLNEKANAKLILQEMINKYPKSNEAKIAKDKLKSF